MILTNPSKYAIISGNMVLIEIPWKPEPKARPRVTRNGCYDPKNKQKQRDTRFLLWILSNMPEIRAKASRGCVKNVRMAFVLPIPKSLSKAKREALAGKPHEKKPDGSNLLKWTEDIGNKILWRDDSLLHNVAWSKIWGEHPRTIIEIEYDSK